MSQYTHLLTETAHDSLDRAYKAARGLSVLLDIHDDYSSDNLITSGDIAALLEGIVNNLDESVLGCVDVLSLDDIRSGRVAYAAAKNGTPT